MPSNFFPLRWESTGDQWWFASPIDWAAANGHYDLVRELLYIDPNLLIKLTSLPRIRRLETVWDDDEKFNDVAKCRSQVAQKLLEECEIEKRHNSLIRAGYGGWLLYTAASAGDVIFVKELLERDPILVFGEGEYGVTDIFYAAARGKSSEVFRMLFEYALLSPKGQKREISPVFHSETVNRAVHAAARGGNVEMLRDFLGDGCDILSYRDAQGSTALHSASGSGQVEVVKYLTSSFDIMNLVDNRGNTALNVAAYLGHLAVIEILVSASPSSTSITNNYGDTFLHAAVAGFRTPTFRRLDRQIELMKQLVSGKLVNLEDIINVKNKDGRTVLHMAVIENIQYDIVELLMSHPYINLNLRDADGNTPLVILKQRPRSASSEIMIKRLISAGGISNCQDRITRKVFVSHLRLHGIGGSPGTVFKIPDAEIFLHSGFEDACPLSGDLTGMEHSYLGEIEQSGKHRRSGSLSNAANRFKRGRGVGVTPIVQTEEIPEDPDQVPLSRRKRKLLVPGEVAPAKVPRPESQPSSSEPPEIPGSLTPISSRAVGRSDPSESVLLVGASGVGVRMMKGLLSPDEETQLRVSNTSHQFFEGVNRTISGLQMLISSFEKAASVAKLEEKRHNSAKSLHLQLQSEIDLLRVLHSQELEGVRTTLSITRGQLESAQEEITSSSRAVEVADSRTEMFRVVAESSKLDFRVMIEERDILTARVEELKAEVRARTQSEEVWRSAFLSSKEFKNAVIDKAFDFFETGFQKSRDQIEEAGLLSPEIQGILSLDRAIESLPADEEEEPVKVPEDGAGSNARVD